MVDITTWFQLGTLGMVVGTVAMVWANRYVPDEQHRESSLLIAVGAIAAVAYALMAVGVGTIQATDGHTIYLARYIDWLLTTPLNVLYLALLADATRRQIGETTGFMALTILLGLVGAYAPPPAKWALFLAGGLVYARVLQQLYGPLGAKMAAKSEALSGLYSKLLNFIAVLWMVYPVIWLLAPSGLGLLDLETQSLVIAYLDVVAKIGFGLIALNGQAAIATFAAEESSDAPTAGSTAD